MKELGKAERNRAILLSIETKVREFPGKVLLACFLAEKGFRVVLTNNRSSREVYKHLAWLFIDRNTFFNRISFFKKLKRLHVKIACLDEEGIVFANPGIYLKRLNPESMRMTDLFLTWGRKQTELVNKIGGAGEVTETGNPRMDLLRPELRGMYQDKADAIKEKYGDFILIASNFAWNNHYYVDGSRDSPTEGYIRLLRRQGLLTNAKEEEFHRANLVYKAKVFEKLQQLVRYLSLTFPDLKIIVRPHPSENHDQWKTSMTGLDNVDVLFEGELESWILAARAVIHNSCTSGLIAALLNRKSIAYMPYEDERFEHELPNSVSAKAYAEEEVADLVRKSPIHQEVPAFLNDHISSLTGKMAAERIADEILGFYRPLPLDAVTVLSMKVLHWLGKVIDRKGKSGRTAPEGTPAAEKRTGFKSYKKQKLDFITAEEVEGYVALYRKMLHKFGSVSAREVDGNIEVSLR